MKKLIHHKETEYDFALTFRDTPAPTMGQSLQSPLIDDDGLQIVFCGTAVVVAIEIESVSDRKTTTVYLRQYPVI